MFLLGLFWKRVTAQGAVAGLGVGFLLGMLKLTIQAFFGAGKATNPAVLAWIGDFNWLYGCAVLFAVSIVIIVVVSLVTPAPDPARLANVTYAGLDKAVVRRSWNFWDVIATVLLLGLILGIYLYFSFWA